MSSSWTEAREGVRDIAPAAIAAIPIGALFGALATAKGLSVAEVALMSAAVFAGGAQFAAVEIWRFPAPVAVLAFSTLLINARHILMGASLAPKVGALRPWQRALSFGIMADENWALMERRALTHPLSASYVFGMGAFFWVSWQIWTCMGALAGSFMGNPRAWGADFAFSALFIGLIASFWKSRTSSRARPADPRSGFGGRVVDLVAGFWKGSATGVTVVASGLAAALAYRWVGPPWHVAAGAVAGIAAAALFSGGADVNASADQPEAGPVAEAREEAAS